MKRYLLDTGPLAALLAGRPDMVSLITSWIAQNEAATSILVYGEVIEHLKGQPDYTDRQQAPRTLLRAVYPYFLTYPVLERYADIRRQM